MFEGSPKSLDSPITAKEVETAFASFYNRACGYDSIPDEFLKYAPAQLSKLIADMFDEEVFEKHLPLEVGTGVLIALQKPGKLLGSPKGLRLI